MLAIAHIDETDLEDLRDALAAARIALRLPEDYAFKHLGASIAVHDQVFGALGRLPIQAHVLGIDKTTWTDEYMRRSRGPDRLCDALISLVLGCPDHLIAGQRLFIDLERKDLPQIRDQRTALRHALAGVGRMSFGKVQPCPDHRLNGTIVQIADMIAGEVHQHGGPGGPYIGPLGSKIHLL